MQRSNAISGLKVQVSDGKDEKKAPAEKPKAKVRIPEYKYHVHGAKTSFHTLVIDSEYNYETKFYDKRYHYDLNEYALSNYKRMNADSSEDGLMGFLKELSRTLNLLELEEDEVISEKLKSRGITLSHVLTAAQRAKRIQESVMTEAQIDKTRPSSVAFPTVYTNEQIAAVRKESKKEIEKKCRKEKSKKKRAEMRAEWRRQQDEWERVEKEKGTWTPEALAGSVSGLYPDKSLNRHPSDLYNSLPLSQPDEEPGTPKVASFYTESTTEGGSSKRQRLEAPAGSGPGSGSGSGSGSYQASTPVSLSKGATLSISKALASGFKRAASMSLHEKEDAAKLTRPVTRSQAAPLGLDAKSMVASSASLAPSSLAALSKFKPAPSSTSKMDEKGDDKKEKKGQGQKRKHA